MNSIVNEFCDIEFSLHIVSGCPENCVCKTNDSNNDLGSQNYCHFQFLIK